MAVGPMAHRHTTAIGADASIAHSGSHSHDYNGGTIDLEIPNTDGPTHSHLDFSFDHLHDSWIYLATTDVPGVDLFSLPSHVDPHFPVQNMLAQIKKPPRITLKS